VAAVARLVGDLEIAEDAVQDACALAVERWPANRPANPRAWLVGVARHKALDRIRREARRPEKEAAAASLYPGGTAAGLAPLPGETDPVADDELALIFTCCHPALDRSVRVPLTLRSVGGLTTAEVAAAFLVPEPTMAKRLVRAKHKIRQAGIPLRVPGPQARPGRLADVLRAALCDTAVRLARRLAELLPGEPEVSGLLALLLLTDARRPARTTAAGELVLLEDQDRGAWDRLKIDEGDRLLRAALAQGRPGPYQLWAAIAACHSTAARAQDTDWRQIAALYGELIRYEPTPVVEANRAVAVAMAEGPSAGLVILDTIAGHPRLRRWPRLYLARADMLRRLGRTGEALDAYRTALELEPPAAERAFIQARLASLAPIPGTGDEPGSRGSRPGTGQENP
jgi:RNA polymerase sigma-70 factor (ECF subfamily)